MNKTEAKELLKQFKSDDKNAIDTLYEIYSGKLYNFAFSYLKTEADSLDVVQSVFINVWDKRESLKNDTNLDAYLFTITKNAVISIFRKKAQEKDYLEHLRNTAVLTYHDTEKQYDCEFLYEKIQQIIEELPVQRKRIFKLSKEKGLSNKDIAAELNISVKTVEDHKAKAKRFIKTKLQESGFIALLFFEMFV